MLKLKMNAVSEAEEGDILFTSSMDGVHLVATNEGMSNDWILDSGASFHVSANYEWFSNYNAGRTGRVMLGNGLACDIVGVGDVQVCFDNGSTFTLHDVRHVPLLTKTWSVQDNLMMQGPPVRLEIVRGRSPREYFKLHKD